jgi:hypothetical protein
MLSSNFFRSSTTARFDLYVAYLVAEGTLWKNEHALLNKSLFQNPESSKSQRIQDGVIINP